MIIQPKIRGFICTTAHPVGCMQSVIEQIQYVKSQSHIDGPKNVLVIGASTGYGLASRIVATFACDAKTIGVFFEKKADERRTATAGWYNSAAFEQLAQKDNYYAKSVNNDAFSDATKKETADLIRRDLKKIDLIVYSVASPRRTHPKTGVVYSSVLKPIDKPFSGKSVDAFRSEVSEFIINPATVDEINNTVAVMGGEDWEMWIDYLLKEDLLADGVKTVAYSYIGPEVTHPIYKEGTIGRAKAHLKQTADKLNQKLRSINGRAFISVNKAVVTQSSAAIPVVPLYIALLFKIMKANNTHEGCIEQIYRLFKDHLYTSHPKPNDEEGNIRIDDLEMRKEVQDQVAQLWQLVNSGNVEELSDLAGYREEFYHLFGFNMRGVDYNLDVDSNVNINSLAE